MIGNLKVTTPLQAAHKTICKRSGTSIAVARGWLPHMLTPVSLTVPQKRRDTEHLSKRSHEPASPPLTDCSFSKSKYGGEAQTK